MSVHRASSDREGDDEYEYEYDDSETEIFYLNLDLTSSNGPIKPARRRSAASSSSSADSEPGPGSARHLDQGLQQQPQDRVQVMQLHTPNPIISYQNQIFSCSWVNLLGTELVFSLPTLHPGVPCLRKDDKVELICASRSKIVGQKSNLISASVSSEPSRAQQQPLHQQSPDARFPTTNQGHFLQRLMNAKRARGEMDTVRIIFPAKQIYSRDGSGVYDSGMRDHSNGPGVEQPEDRMQIDGEETQTR